MAPADKYSVKMADEQIENYKQMFMMFDKVCPVFNDMISHVVL